MPKISQCRLSTENLHTIIFRKNVRFGLSYDLKDFGFEEKWGFEIWLSD